MYSYKVAWWAKKLQAPDFQGSSKFQMTNGRKPKGDSTVHTQNWLEEVR